MTSRSMCNFKGCNKSTSHWDSFFKKWACEDHAFDLVVWPDLGNEYKVEQRLKKDSLNEYYRELKAIDSGKTYKRKKSSSGIWGKKYFKQESKE